MKEELFRKQNKQDYSIKQGAIKSATELGFKDVPVGQLKQTISTEEADDQYWENMSYNPECELENSHEVYRDDIGLLQLRKRAKI